jgi:hypothetical protein
MQAEFFPVGTKVIARRECPGMKANGAIYGYLAAGERGEVIGHTEDGRARISFSGVIHTFDDPLSFVMIELDAIAELAAPRQRVAELEAQRWVPVDAEVIDCNCWGCNRGLSVSGNSIVPVGFGFDADAMILPDDVRLCRLVSPASDGEGGEG